MLLKLIGNVIVRVVLAEAEYCPHCFYLPKATHGREPPIAVFARFCVNPVNVQFVFDMYVGENVELYVTSFNDFTTVKTADAKATGKVTISSV